MMRNEPVNASALRGGAHSSALLRLFLVAWSAALAAVVVGGWSSAWAQGPALWIAETHNAGVSAIGPGPVELTPPQLRASGPVTPPVTLTESDTTDAVGLAFRGASLWVTTLENQVLEFTPRQLRGLSKTPTPTPAITITSSSFSEILGCTFDRRGNLWITDANLSPGGVHELTKSQLTKSGDLTPAVTIQWTGAGSPAFAIFDKAGNLWVSGEASNQIAEFTPKQLTTSSTDATPAVVISSPSLDGPGQMAFDRKRNLWVANAVNSTVTEFTAAQLMASGSPAAAVVLSADASGSLATPWGLQFDRRGNLWVFDYLTGNLVEFTPAELKEAGSPTPAIILTGLNLYAAQMTFGPSIK